MKKKMRNFFTLTRKSNGGFTLVELIVVIAILAILGGVAIPAYSGYIEKTKYAADETLLNAVNKAFASACAANGTDVYLVDSAHAELNTDKTVKAVYKDSVDDEYNVAFDMFFEGNEDTAFQVYEELFFHPTLHMFAENAAVTFTFGDTTITLSAEDIAIISGDNAFSNRGAEALLADIGVLETLLGDYKDVMDEITEDPDFIYALGSYMGLSQGELDYEAYLEKVSDTLDTTYGENGLYSAQIMYAASNAANATEDQIGKLFTYNENQKLTSRIEGDTAQETMANAALAYGMYTAYLQQNPDIDSETNEGSFGVVVNTREFAEYCESDLGRADLEAYRASMNMVSDNTSNPEVTESIMENGITNNDDLAALMKEIMGN